ncbi:hypothetical protein K505DRAFT_146552 [Melanomma pulvis-pyrius CBS 109.77]|uniref:Uncharacterized protein n=1 Tax=Melanomma pulvis-pyrius CBS 109.77 TaxID=1314802 RepID=A0A6A6WR10_9PLEO|nr:hypothetical protein K505DRAFT_146552 [Melanomma pulvis-pyrius CBS 109.77]
MRNSKYRKGTTQTSTEQNKVLKNVLAWAINDLDSNAAGHRSFTCSHNSLANMTATQVSIAPRTPRDVANDLFDKMRDDQDFRDIYFSVRRWMIDHTEAHEATHPKVAFTSSDELKRRCRSSPPESFSQTLTCYTVSQLDKEREVLIKYHQ